MNQIKFSHNYTKLAGISQKITGGKHPVTLLDVFVKDAKELSPDFIKYDTTYIEGTDFKNYKLPTGVVLVLLFIDFKGNLFTTVRSEYGKTGHKFPYYNSKRGEAFEIVYTNVGAE